MSKTQKYDMILDALQSLLEQKDIQTISVSEIAQTAGIGKYGAFPGVPCDYAEYQSGP